ncbi:MAG: energy transducer TonB [Alteromonadaceae bacterium]|nr:energy transducer TonB [Alteromonadaceae bacterium]
MAVQVTDLDRFSFTLFMALAVHAIIGLGLTFTPEEPPASAKTMEITLSQFDDQQAPDEADFLAQTNQQGSGTTEKKVEMTSPEPAELSKPEVAQIQPRPQTTTEPSPQQAQAVVQTENNPDREVAQPDPKTEPVPEPLPRAENKSLLEESLEVASLEARLADQQQAYAKRPRIKYVTATSTLKSSNAWYVQNWVDKVTRVGNLNYPQQARRAGIHGNLRLLVQVRKDGTIREVAILESSGSSVLDDAAIQIVRRAAPFAPFPEDLEEQYDVLEIIRTWSFQRKGLTAG